MSERELRDTVERLYEALKHERARLEVPEAEVLAKERTALKAEIEALTQRATALRKEKADLEVRHARALERAEEAEAAVASARREIARREDLGNPLAESRSNWEAADPQGCSTGLVALVSLASALAWRWWS